MKSIFMNREIVKVYKIRCCLIIKNFKIAHRRKSKNIDEHSYPFRKQSVQCLKYPTYAFTHRNNRIIDYL